MVIALTIGTLCLADAPDFVTATEGCPMAHCDSRMSDQVNAIAPVGSGVSILYHDTTPQGAGFGLGCSSNHHVAACTYYDTNGNTLKVYGPEGESIFTSGGLLSPKANASAPIIDVSGRVIAADEVNLILFDHDGQIIWQRALPGGTPISPVPTANGVVLVATWAGPISAYSLKDGSPVGTITVTDPSGRTYQTKNTPSVNGNRAYVSMAAVDDASYGELVAIEIDPLNVSSPLTVKWAFPFGGGSGASPLTINDMIYFDGAHLTPKGITGPYVFGVKDLGSTFNLIWKNRMPTAVKASPAQDPRGGLWVFGVGATSLLRLSETIGTTLQTIDLATVLPPAPREMPTTAMSIARGPNGETIMLVGASPVVGSGGPSYALALNLDSSSLIWKVQLDAGDMTACQFPIVANSQGSPRVVFPGMNSGAYFVGDPLAPR
jgi:hypothetical protein